MPVTQEHITAAALRVTPHVRTTPLWVLPSTALGLPAGTPGFEVWLKLEHLQLSGSFKARGMFNRLLSNPIPAAGVIAASGGNAGIATAVAARALGVPAEIYVPGVISAAKRERLAIKVSRDGGKTWPVERVIHEGPAAYSNLVELADHNLGLLYENGTKSPYEKDGADEGKDDDAENNLDDY